jgi:[protein-PII] uridylyltransferase
MLTALVSNSFTAAGGDLARLREAIAARREAIRQDHAQRRNGGATVAALTELMDAVVRALHQRVVVSGDGRDRPGSGCAVVAVGGYGRGELFPASDVDLMFLYDPPARGEALAVSNGVLHPLWDLGYTVGHSLRRIPDCLELGHRDATIRTALMEARWIAGDRGVYDAFERAFSAQLHKESRLYLAQKLVERDTGFARYGSTVYLLEPDIKKSKGGLRDLHYVAWLGRACYGATAIDELVDRGALTDGERRSLVVAHEFLRLIRNEMHFGAGKAGDVLTFDEQVRVARFLGYEDGPELLGVEGFMQQYYRLSTTVHETSDRFIRRLQSPTVWRRLTTALTARAVDGLFVVSRDEVSIPERHRAGFLADPHAVLTLFAVAQHAGRPIAESALDLVHHRLFNDAPPLLTAPETQRRFFALFANPGIGRTLEAMHRVGLLERLLPEFASARGLMQFNQYHKYTVDVHSVHAVQAACALAACTGRVASVYRGIHRKDILHLALLLHDIGKGRGGDHSLIGEGIAAAVADRLGFDAHERHLLTFLVRYHLIMSHIAFRRDLSDEKVLVRFTRQVGHPELLQMLLVFTYADIEAVGPGTWTAWKEDLLCDLHAKAMEAVAGTRAVGDEGARTEAAKAAVRERAGDRFPALWLTRQFEAMPARYLLVTTPNQILTHLDLVHRLPPDGVLVEARWDPEPHTTEWTIATFDGIIPGLFSKLAGTLAALGFQILSAQVFTRFDGVVIDTFHVQDPDYAGEPSPHRSAELKRALTAVVTGHQRVEDLFARGRRLPRSRALPHGLEPTQVEIDNETSDDFTIIDVFATDAQGLLFVITRTLFTLGLSIYSSRISTRLDQVVDVFYIQDAQGRKVTDLDRIIEIKRTLTAAVDEYVTHAPLGQSQSDARVTSPS